MPRSRALLPVLLVVCAVALGALLVHLVGRGSAAGGLLGTLSTPSNPREESEPATATLPLAGPATEPRPRLHGRVIEATTREPLAGFRLRIEGGTRTLFELRSDDDGAFVAPLANQRPERLVVLPPAGYTLESAEIRLDPAQRGGDTPVQVVAHRTQPLFAAGRLVDAVTREALPEFQLKVARRGRAPERVTTDAEGRFRARTPAPLGSVRAELVDSPELRRPRAASIIDLPTHALDASVPLRELELADISVDVGPTFHLTLPPHEVPAALVARLEPDWRIDERSLQVLGLGPDWNAAPVRYEPTAAGSAPWVRFASAGPPPPAGGASWTLVLRDRAGLWTARASVPVRRGVHAVVVEPEATGRLEGRVHDGSGVGLRGAAVSLGTADGRAHATTTDAGGEFELAWLPPGRHVLRVVGPRDAVLTQQVELVAGATTRTELTLVPPRAAAYVRGTLHSRTGTHRAPVTMQLRPVGEAALGRPLEPPRVEWQKGADGWVGAFAFEDLAAGEYELTIAGSPYGRAWKPARRRVTPPASKVEFVLQDDVALEHLGFVVEDAESRTPIERFSLVSHPILAGADAPGWFAHGSTATGAPAVTVAAGHAFAWFLVAEGHRPASGTRAAFEEPDAPAELTATAHVMLAPGWGACAVVVGPSGQPLAGVEVLVDGATAGRTQAGGWLHLSRPAAPTAIALRHEGWELDRGNVAEDGSFSVHNGLLWVSMRPR